MIGKVKAVTLCNRCNQPVSPDAELQRSGPYAWLCADCEAELARARPGGATRGGSGLRRRAAGQGPARSEACMSTTVISVRGRDRAALLADPTFVYCGRRCAGWNASSFANPFKVKEYGGEALSLFDRCLRAAIGECPWPVAVDVSDAYFRRLAGLLPSLKGKVLGCWCGCWQPGTPDLGCHAVTLARLADAPEARP